MAEAHAPSPAPTDGASSGDESTRTADPVAAMEAMVRAHSNAADADYWAYQKPRYARTLRRIRELAPPGARILDIGSHYLHQAGVLRLAGFEVTGLDVPVFTDLDWIRRRADRLGVRNEPADDFEPGDFLPGASAAFDVVLFTEALEHITFNPVRFWRRVAELLQPDGFIYLTTPNAYEFRNLRKVVKRLVTGRGIGLRPGAILRHVTYGHHWKLYCAREIREYFAELSDDFEVAVATYSLARGDGAPRHATREALQRLFDRIPLFRSHLEAVIRLTGRDGWKADPPTAE